MLQYSWLNICQIPWDRTIIEPQMAQISVWILSLCLFAAGFFSGAASTASFVFLSGARGATPSSTSYPLRTCTSILSFLISSSISLGDLWTLARVLFTIFLALYANFNVWTDSSRWTICLLLVQIRVVFELPPRASLRKKVSFESLKGTWWLPSVSALIQTPSDVRLKLIFFASSRT